MILIKDSETRKNVRRNISEKLEDNANNIIDSLLEKEYQNTRELEQELDNLMNDYLIYFDDQWLILQDYYISPCENMSFDIAWVSFRDSILNCLKLEEL